MRREDREDLAYVFGGLMVYGAALTLIVLVLMAVAYLPTLLGG